MASAKQQTTLYAIPGSHAAHTGELLLRHKGVPFRRVNIPPPFHRVVVRLLGYPGARVPAVRFPDGSKVHRTKRLARALDERQPEPRLVPDDPRVLEAEAWGEKALQQWSRRMVAAAGVRGTDRLHEGGADGRMGPLLARNAVTRRAICAMIMLAFSVTPKRQREDWAQRGEMFDRVDAWIEDGVLNGEQLNSADLIIVTSLALVDYRRDVRPEMEGRPLYGLVERVLPLPARSESAPASSTGRKGATTSAASSRSRASRSTG